MPAAINLEGCVFGRLKIFEARSGTRIIKRAWRCLCSCGAEVWIQTSSLTSGNTQSCGCLQKDRARQCLGLRPYEGLYRHLRRTATKQAHVCTITYDDFAQLATTKTCHYCWAPIHWAEVHKVNASWGYNLDRKDSNKGYTNDNCVVCCVRCNRGKCDLFTYDEWRAMTAIFRNGELCPSN